MIQVESAMKIAVRAHKHQVDKVGQPYVAHCVRVAGKLEDLDVDDLLVVAWMHDVIEDTNFLKIDYPFSREYCLQYQWELEDRYGMSAEQAKGLVAMTRFSDESYREYTERVKRNFIARLVKLADLADNLSPARLDQIQPKGLRDRLREKYLHTRAYLMEED